MKKLFAVILILIVTAFAGNSAYADCTPIYGGGQTCTTQGNILLNKTVENPSTGAFVDNLSVNDPRFANGNQVTFQLNVTNTGNATLSKVTVTDTLPGELDFVSGPGNYDKNSKNLTFQVMNLNAGETRTFTVVTKVISSNSGIKCEIPNLSTAVTNDNQSSTDIARFCVENGIPSTTTKGGLPIYPAPVVKTTPPTGPEMLPLLGLIPGGLAGLFLRKKTSK